MLSVISSKRYLDSYDSLQCLHVECLHVDVYLSINAMTASIELRTLCVDHDYSVLYNTRDTED